MQDWRAILAEVFTVLSGFYLFYALARDKKVGALVSFVLAGLFLWYLFSKPPERKDDGAKDHGKWVVKNAPPPPSPRVDETKFDPALAEILTNPRGLPGGASGGNDYWPARFTFPSFDRVTGDIIGQAEWLTSGCVAKVGGKLTGQGLTLKGMEPLNSLCESGPEVTYKLSARGSNRLVGTWVRSNSSGPTWIVLEKPLPATGASGRVSGRGVLDLVHGFEFRLKRCLLSEYTLVCDLFVVNHSEDRQLTLGSDGSAAVEAYDNLGNRYTPENIQLANEHPAQAVSRFMVSGVSTLTRIVFLHFKRGATRLPLLKLPCRTQPPASLAFVATLRNVPVEK